MLGLLDGLRRGPGGSIVPGQPLARILNKGLAGSGAELPEAVVSDATNTLLLKIFFHSQPTVFAASLGPKFVGSRRIPSRVMNSIGDMADGNFLDRPVRKKIGRASGR